jgi:hypothetical protein
MAAGAAWLCCIAALLLDVRWFDMAELRPGEFRASRPKMEVEA